MNRRRFLRSAIVMAGTVLAVRGAVAAEPAAYTGIVPGVGAGGYDVVDYFDKEQAVPGDPAITAAHEGVTYRFESAENRDKFLADPTVYLPQFGGYCAYAVSKGALAKGDPEAWTLHGGKLYLNYSQQVRSVWREDVDGNIVKAEGNWPGVLE